MYAILRAGGKQVKVAPGDVVRIERRPGRRPTRARRWSCPTSFWFGGGGRAHGRKDVTGVKVVATVLSEVRSRKVLVFKKKRTKQYRRTKGHRQNMVEVRIDGIERVGDAPWHTRRDRAPRATAATRTRSGWASSASAASSSGRLDPRPPARDEVLPGRERRPRQGRHALREGHGHRPLPRPRAAAAASISIEPVEA